MSLSQKHSGKVLVPWFNITEWETVYHLIYTEENQDWPKALKVLKTWKLRTPLLSAGVEGTLILLEALLVDTHKLSGYEITHIFSTSLVRFLNLCAANTDKQGTFYKAAMKNSLPKWLINLRHDIAHSHYLPSQSMLELSLRFSLSWIKDKYWKVQYQCMSDLIVNKSKDNLLEDAVYIHIRLAQLGVLEMNDEALMVRINRLAKYHDQNQFTAKELLDYVNSILKNTIRNNIPGAADKVCSLIIESCVIFQTEFEIDTSGMKNIPNPFLTKWKSLLNVIYESEIMTNFVYKLLDFLSDDKYEDSHKEIASLWIRDIFEALLYPEKKAVLNFNSNSHSIQDKQFVMEALKNPTPFSVNFLKTILQYNNAPTEFIEDATSLLIAFFNPEAHNTENILTINDLNLNQNLVINGCSNTSQRESVFRWVPVEDTTSYNNLPLGILPHQSRNVNPVLNI